MFHNSLVPERNGHKMMLGPHGKFLVEYVMSFVNDDIARWEFDIDYSGYVLAHFPGFEAETPRLAAKFVKTIDQACVSYSWMDDKSFALALSDELDLFLGTPKLPDFY